MLEHIKLKILHSYKIDISSVHVKLYRQRKYLVHEAPVGIHSIVLLSSD